MKTTGLATGMKLPTAEERAESLKELLAYAAGWISEPGDENGTWDTTEHADLDADCEEWSAPECREPRVTKSGWRAMRAA
jgi:hypothetical protein